MVDWAAYMESADIDNIDSLEVADFQVKVVNGDIAITNLHVGSLGDILTYPIDVDPDLNISKIQLMDAILKELSSEGFNESEASDFWSDFDNLQKAKIIR